MKISNKNLKICVVENIADQWSIESSSVYQGYFHILGGTLSSNNSNKEELLIGALVERVKKENRGSNISYKCNNRRPNYCFLHPK